ncbi:HAD family acid phosphatase [Mycoplasmopsis cricetuli]|uniref:HAD family acid phosphatase n=1 Tax=Mycoplasmopsis cricetuli TaxID=171283 RepID=UPI0004726C0F|nr:HAD family acid phosphatase [Mycoplasmopsis cricetuli]
MKKWRWSNLLATAIPVLTLPTIASSCNYSDLKPTDDQEKINEKILNASKYTSGAWNTISAEKKAMTINLYQAAIKQFDALVSGQSDVFDNSKVKVENNKVTVSNTENGKSIPVVFMDIDETILNNFAYQNWLVLNHQTFNQNSWNDFVQDKQSIKIDGAFEFIDYVWKHGGVVMFNSNREQENQLIPTRENLISQGLNKSYLPDWTFWMQGVDLSKDKPWSNIQKDSNNKRIKSAKEARMNLVNSKIWDLTTEGENFGNAVSLKTVMRIGDNFDDFNDIASKDKTNEQRNKVLEDTGKLFGNFDPNTKGIKFTKNEKGEIIKSEENWSESYVLIGGNSSYGGWESGLSEKYFTLNKKDQIKALDNALNSLLWKPSKVN